MLILFWFACSHGSDDDSASGLLGMLTHDATCEAAADHLQDDCLVVGPGCDHSFEDLCLCAWTEEQARCVAASPCPIDLNATCGALPAGGEGCPSEDCDTD